MKIDSYLKNTDAYTITARNQSVEEMMIEHNMLVSMEKQRIAQQFPWKRKGYRKQPLREV